MYRIVEVFIGLKRNFAMALASVILIFLTLFLLGFSLIITINAREMSSNVIESLKMHVYLEPDISEGETQQAVNEIENLSGVKTTEFSDKEEQLIIVTNSLGDDAEVVQEYFSGAKNPLNDVVNVEVVDDSVDMNLLKDNILEIENVESASYGEDYGADDLIKAMRQLSVGAIIVALIFAIITIFLIINTIKLTINSRRKEIEIMRLVGATKTYITFPFAFEGALLGLFGGFLAFVTVYFSYASLVSDDAAFLFKNLLPASHIIKQLVIGQILFGILIGLIGAIIAIRNYLKA